MTPGPRPALPRPVAFPRSRWRRTTRKCRRPPGARSRRRGEAEPRARRPSASGPPRGPPAPERQRPPPPVPLHPTATRPRPQARPRGGAEARGRRRERFARGSEAARAAGGSYYRGREEEPSRARGPAPAGREARRRRAGSPGLRIGAGAPSHLRRPPFGPWRPGLTCPEAWEPPVAAEGQSRGPAERGGADARRGPPRGGLDCAAR